MTLLESPLPQGPNQPDSAGYLPFRTSGELRNFSLDSMVEVEKVDAPQTSRPLPDLSDVKFIPERQTNVGVVPPNPTETAARQLEIFETTARRANDARIFGGHTGEEVAALIAKERAERTGSVSPVVESPLASLRTPYREAKRPSAENKFREGFDRR